MARAFADVLRDLTGGQTYEELGSALTEIVDAVMQTRRSGSLTLTLKIKSNGDSSVIITDDVKTKLPQPIRGETIFFTQAGGNLLREDPRQEKLPLRQVAEAIPAAKGA
jgi:hypothetical protein